MDRHLSSQEVVRRFGVSIKALRLYERHGLLTPLRSEAGWRTYGPAQVARLHQVLILKRLGLPLARIAQLLAGRDDLDAVLALQEQVLTRQSQSAAQALALVRSARAKLASGAALSIDDLANLNKETVMTEKVPPEEMRTLFAPLVERHFTPEDRAALKARSFNQAEVTATWQALRQEAFDLMQAGDSTSPTAMNLARRWQMQLEQFTGGDSAMLAKARAVWVAALKDPATAARLDGERLLHHFMEGVLANLKALET